MLLTITIPLYILLLIYALAIIGISVFVVINIYRLFSSASFTFTSFFITFFVISSQIIILLFTWNILQGIDWTTPLITLDIPSLSTLFNQNSTLQ